MAKIVGIGEICVAADYIGTGIFAASSVACILATMANFGDENLMVSMMADDAVSRDICKKLQLSGINTDGIGFKKDKDNIIALATQNADVCYYCGNNAFFEMGWDDIDVDKLLEADWCFVSVTALAGKYTRNALMPILRLLKGKGIKTACDLTYKKEFWQNEGMYREMVFYLASLCDCVFIDDKDKWLASEVEKLKDYTCFARYESVIGDIKKDRFESAKGAFSAGLIHSLCDGADIKRAVSAGKNAADFVLKNGGGLEALPGLSVLM